jgi:hypothetical protein
LTQEDVPIEELDSCVDTQPLVEVEQVGTTSQQDMLTVIDEC